MATDLMGLTEYQKLLQAVESYYGAGSDQWLTIASQSNIQSTEWAQILSQTPNVNVITNNAGEVVSYTVSESFGTAVDSAGAVINSNTQAATMTQAAQLSVPANTTVTQTGTVAASSGMKTVASGTAVKTVVKDVALGVGAVAVGIQLGSLFDQILYNANPDFWNEHGMETLNPQTWDSICSTKTGKKVFNFVFGIDKTTGQTQAYADQRTLAYIAQYLVSRGVYDAHGEGETGQVQGLTPLNPPFIYSMYPYASGEAVPTNAAGRYGGATFTAPVYSVRNEVNEYGYYSLLLASSAPFKYGVTSPTDMDAASFTNDGITVYWGQLQFKTDYNTGAYSAVPYCSSGYAATEAWDIIATGVYSQVSGVEGITPQTGATLPTGITPYMPIDDVIAQLQTLYPDIFNDAIYNDVVQPDGSIKRYTYVPVGFPDGYTIDQTTGDVLPTGGVGTSQADPTIDPTNTPVSLIDTLLQILESTDPYNPTTPSDTTTTDYPDTGGGTTPPFVIPTGSASALYSVYNPTQAQLNSLGAWLWSSNFVDQLLKLFNDPMQAIIGLHKVFATPPTSGTGSIKVGYLDSGVSSKLVSAQYTEVDCGTVQLKEYFGNALDYTKTDMYLYLPFVGIVPLSVEDVTRANVNVKYKVDVLTGACLATVNVTRDNNAGGQLYAYAGNCAVQYPLSSGSYMGIVASALGIAGSVAGTILSGGAMLPMALGVGASALGSARTQVEHSGSLSGNAGAMGIKKPYVIIRRPQTKIANNYPLMAGGSNNVYGVLSSYTGFTRVKYVHLENIPATSDELTEIENLLTGGVMI